MYHDTRDPEHNYDFETAVGALIIVAVIAGAIIIGVTAIIWG